MLCCLLLQVYVKQKTDEILNLNNEVARLKKELESYEADAMVQQAKKDHSLQVRVWVGMRCAAVSQLALPPLIVKS